MTAKVLFVPVDPPGPGVTALHGDGPFVATAGGGWAFQSRPRRVAFTEWAGEDPYTLTGQILFDGFARDQSVQGPVESMRVLLRNPVGPRKEPPVLQVRGPAIPQAHRRWVLQSFEPDDEVRRSDGTLVRAFFTVTLLEYLPGDALLSVKPTPARTTAGRTTTAAGTTKKTTAKTYTVKRGDTLSAIAARTLGSASKWHAIADLNNIRDPKALRVGQVLRLP